MKGMLVTQEDSCSRTNFYNKIKKKKLKQLCLRQRSINPLVKTKKKKYCIKIVFLVDISLGKASKKKRIFYGQADRKGGPDRSICENFST